MPSTATPSPTSPQRAAPVVRWSDALLYLLLGTFFGIVLIKSEVVSWFRIQEMFRFQSFHMYGIIGSAIAVGALSIQISDKPFRRGTNQILGGIVFGLGWGLLGACPGPIYALIGAGITPMFVGLGAAILGAWTYGQVKPHLPH